MWTSSSPTNFLRFLKDKKQGYKGGGDLDEQLKWNEDNPPEVEDDKQLKANGNPVIAPQEQFFNKELKLNEVRLL